MDNEEFDRAKPVVDMAQRFYASLNGKLTDYGVAPVDALIASTYATHKLATDIHGNPITAVMWMRDALDQIERQALDPPQSNSVEPVLNVIRNERHV